MAELSLDLRYAEVEYDLWAVGHLLNVIEPAITSLSHQDARETLAQLRANGSEVDEADVDIAHQEIREKADFVLPRLLRGPVLVSLWACFESAVVFVANRRRFETAATLEITEINGDSFLSRARRYFEAVLALELEPDGGRYARLVDLYRVRNAIAHANGLRQGMSERQWSKLTETLERRGERPDESRGAVILSPKFVREAYEDVNNSLRGLVARAKEQSTVAQ